MGKIRGGENVTMRTGRMGRMGRMRALSSMANNARRSMKTSFNKAGKFLMKVPTPKLPMASSQFMNNVKRYSNRFMGKMKTNQVKTKNSATTNPSIELAAAATAEAIEKKAEAEILPETVVTAQPSEKVPGVMGEVLNRCFNVGVDVNATNKATSNLRKNTKKLDDVAENIYFPARYYNENGPLNDSHDKNKPGFPDNPENYSRGIKVSEFNKCLMREYEKSLLLLCQPIGGFQVDFQLLAEGQNGTPEKIFERLKHISTHNLVAFSEGGEVEYSEETKIFDPMIKVGNFKCCKQDPFAIDDTGFVGDLNSIELKFSNGTLNNISLHKGDKSVFSNSKYLESHGLNILNVHLPSKGPGELYKPDMVKAFVESIVPETIEPKDIHYESIKYFLKTYLPSNTELQSVIPDIIVGDTNITCSKCVTKNIKSDSTNRMDIIRHITKALNELYNEENYSWGVVMNPIKIEKIRSYGFLLNQQINKSNLKEATEEDGTIIAFKYLTVNKDKLHKEFFTKHCGKYWEVCLGSTETDYISETLSGSVKFLTFDTKPDNCLDKGYKLQDNLFIDHAPVQFSFEGMKSLKKNTLGGSSESSFSEPVSPVPESSFSEPVSPVPNSSLPETNSPNNLIALNLGSIINSKKKWNLNLINIIKDIQDIDRTLFQGVRDAICQDSLNKLTLENGIQKFDYNSFKGKEFGNLLLTEKSVENVANAMNKAEIQIKELFGKKKIKYPGNALSGQPVALSGQPVALSDQPVALSGQPVALSDVSVRGGFKRIKSKKNQKIKKKNKSKYKPKNKHKNKSKKIKNNTKRKRKKYKY